MKHGNYEQKKDFFNCLSLSAFISTRDWHYRILICDEFLKTKFSRMCEWTFLLLLFCWTMCDRWKDLKKIFNKWLAWFHLLALFNGIKFNVNNWNEIFLRSALLQFFVSNFFALFWLVSSFSVFTFHLFSVWMTYVQRRLVNDEINGEFSGSFSCLSSSFNPWN
jgi:hypothetical protein